MYLLDKSEMPYTDRGKPVLVTRRLSAMVRFSDMSCIQRNLLIFRWRKKKSVEWQITAHQERIPLYDTSDQKMIQALTYI